jgi:hypothetical protein
VTLADELLKQTQHILDDDATPRQASLYRQSHGLHADGARCQPLTVTQLAEQHNIPTSSVVQQLAAIEARVYRHLCRYLINRIERDEPATIEWAMGATSTVQERDVYTGYLISGSNGARSTTGGITLGAGSEAASAAAKHGGEHRRTQATIAAHQRYADGGRHA